MVLSMAEAIKEFTFECKIRKLSTKTVDNYRKQLLYLQRYLEKEFQVKNVDEVRSIHIKQFLAMKDDQGCNQLPNTLSRSGHASFRHNFSQSTRDVNKRRVKIFRRSDRSIKRGGRSRRHN